MTRRAHRATRAHMYVDESAASDYLVIGALVASADVARARAAMKGLLLPGQRSLHMKNERNRAGQILGVVIELQPRVLIYRVERGVPAMEARSRCVRALARDACELGVARVVFDAIESVVDRDRSWGQLRIPERWSQDPAVHLSPPASARGAIALDRRRRGLGMGSRRRASENGRVDHRQNHRPVDGARPDTRSSGRVSGSLLGG